MIDAHVHLEKGDYSTDMLECMVKCNVPILTASDAHSPQNVGLYIKEMNDLIQSV